MVSYLVQMITKKGFHVQSVHIAMTGSQPAKPKMMLYMGKVEYEKYPNAMYNSSDHKAHLHMT